MVIYKTTNLVNGKIYVGQDLKNNPKYLGSGKILKQAIKKYGRENFKKEILEYCISRLQLNDRERYWIKELKARKEFGNYNLTDGGEGVLGLVHSKLSREKISKANKGRSPANKGIPHSEETKALYSIQRKGEGNSMYGKHHSEETKQKISESKTGKETALKGRPKSEEHRKKLSEARAGKFYGENHPMYGKHHSEETKQKISDNHYDVSGTNNPMYGKTHSEETKQKIRDTKAWTRFKKSLAVVNQSLIDNPHTNN